MIIIFFCLAIYNSPFWAMDGSDSIIIFYLWISLFCFSGYNFTIESFHSYLSMYKTSFTRPCIYLNSWQLSIFFTLPTILTLHCFSLEWFGRRATFLFQYYLSHYRAWGICVTFQNFTCLFTKGWSYTFHFSIG